MEQMVRCANCGTANPAGQQFCGSCGARLVAVVHQAPTASQQASTAPALQASTMPTQEVPTVPAQQAPGKAVRPVVQRQQFEAKPTWGLAWGLWWRMLLLSILIFGILYLIAVIVMVLGFDYKIPFVA